MITFKFDNTIGYVLNSLGDVQLIDGIDALRQSIEARLQFFQGEWFLDTAAGLAYLTDFRGPPVDPALIANAIRNEILKETEVTQVSDIPVIYDQEKRTYQYSFSAQTVYTDTLEFSGQI